MNMSILQKIELRQISSTLPAKQDVWYVWKIKKVAAVQKTDLTAELDKW